eukprot:TRINITY_DN3669_c0_g4_i1.p1 TRINITY_DN3669_c0_g4~~TRINITY_DN3669_c0_g4_i1.p1  ORF type:complete len:1118 (+),score=297.78 TRINITY_DN3669_c0_g4_i1:93-3446(+)
MDQQFLEIVKNLLSADNNLRNASEKAYGEAKKNAPVQCVASLFQVLAETKVDQPVREQSAVLLRQCCGKITEDKSTWSCLGAEGQADVRTKLLQLLDAEPDAKVRRKVSDCIQSLANQIINIDSDQRPKNCQEWPELMPLLMQIICNSGKDKQLRADCLWIVKEMTCSVWQMMVSSPEQTSQVLQLTLGDASEEVKSEAGCMFVGLIDNIETKEERKPFASLIPGLSEVIGSLAACPDSKHLNNVLQQLQATTETADFLKNHIFSHLLPVLCNIAKSHNDEASRKYAFEVILTFAESKPKMIFKTEQYVTQAFEVCVHFMLQLDEDAASWAEQDDEEGEDDEEAFVFGKEAVDRICRVAAKVEKFPAVLEVLKQAIAKLFQSGDWKQVIGALSILSMMAEYVDDEQTVTQMLQGVKAQLGASHPRVRYVAWAAVAQFSEDHADVITETSTAGAMLQEFMKGLDDPCERVRVRSMEAFQHFGESVEREDLEPFVQPMMEKLGPKLQSGTTLIQKKAITFIAVIAGQVEDAFAQYYSLLMPIMKQVIQTTLHNEKERTLLGKCFECISLLARAVGNKGFKADAEQIMQAMIQATKMPNLPNNDPVKEYMMAAAERICGTMKADFVPFIPHILPLVIEKFKLAPREYTGEADGFADNDEVNLTLMPTEDGQVKVMIMYSSELQDLKAALECVHTFVEELEGAYSPFVAQTAHALLPVFEFSMAEEIRDLAFETWGELCGSAKQGGQNQVVGELVMEFLKRVLPKFESEGPLDLEGLKTCADGVTTCLKKAGPGILSADQVQHICKVMMNLIGESLKRRQESAKGPAKQADEDGDVEDDDEEETENNFRIGLCEAAGSVMQHHADMFVANSFPSWIELVGQWLQPGATEDDKKLALFISCDFLEHLGDKVVAAWPRFVPAVIQGILDPNAEVRQPSCYGLSLAAKWPAFAELAPDAAAKLAQVITETRKRSKKKSDKLAQACADNALSALVEILQHHPAVSQAAPQLWGVWLQGLPCQEDEQEGERNHKTLLKLMQAQKPEVIGEGGANVPRLFGILVDQYKTEMVDEETTKGIGAMALAIGEARLEGFASQWSEKQKKKVVRILREAKQPADGFNPPPRT